MPMQVTRDQPIPNHFQPNQQQKAAAHEVIARLQYADLWRGAGTLHKNNLVRIDMQGTITGDPVRHNIQAQINGVRGNSTIAHADVSASLMTNDPSNQRGVAGKVISALNQSLDSGCSYRVTGTSP
jgi:hypothetical protein